MSGEIRINERLPEDQILSREALLQELEGIQNKTPANWYDIGLDGRLVVVQPPSDCLSWVWEILVRFFTGKFSLLERKMTWITQQVEEYLLTEKDPNLRGEFCDENNNAINRLYEAAAKLHKKQRISEEAFQTIQDQTMIRARVLTSEDPQRLVQDGSTAYHPFSYLAHLITANDLPNSQAVFAFEEDEPNVSGTLGQRIMKDGDAVDFAIHSRGNKRKLYAGVERRYTLAHLGNDHRITLGNNGAVTTQVEGEQLEERRAGLRFVNGTDKSMNVEFERPLQRVVLLEVGASYTNASEEVEEINVDGQVVQLKAQETYVNNSKQAQQILFRACMYFTLQPDESRKYIQSEADEEIVYKVSYTTPSIAVNFACKMGKYVFRINQQGELVKRISTQRITGLPETSYDERVPVPTEDRQSLVITNNKLHDIWAAVQVQDTNLVEHLYIPPAHQGLVSHEKLIAQLVHIVDMPTKERFDEQGIPVTVAVTQVELEQ